MTAERVEFYQRPPPTPHGRNIPVALDRFPIDNLVPWEEEVVRAVQNLQLNRSGGPSGMRVENIWD